jgi:hypothetical protein
MRNMSTKTNGYEVLGYEEKLKLFTKSATD